MKRMAIAVEISGITPLLMNRFHEAAQLQVDKGTSMTVNGDRGSPREQAEPKVYANATGAPVIPGPNFFACLVEAGRFHKVGKRQVTTGKSSLVPAAVSVMEIDSVVMPSNWEVDSRPVVNPSTRGRRLCHRPRFDEWKTHFTLDVDTDMFDPKFIRQLVDDGGLRIGLGDYRPDRKGPFGRFKVTSWEVSAVV